MAGSLPDRVQISSDVLYQELDGESVLLDLKSERYFGLDDVGTRIWMLLGERGDPAFVCAQLAAEYDAEEATLRRDVAELIAKLAEAGLVTVDPSTSGGHAAGQAP
jgi:hypothetical protein